jgi:hypothetical protein
MGSFGIRGCVPRAGTGAKEVNPRAVAGLNTGLRATLRACGLSSISQRGSVGPVRGQGQLSAAFCNGQTSPHESDKLSDSCTFAAFRMVRLQMQIEEQVQMESSRRARARFALRKGAQAKGGVVATSRPMKLAIRSFSFLAK